MSRSIGIDFTLAALPSLGQFVDLLRVHGAWVGRGASLAFMSNEDGLYDWNSRPLADTSQVLAHISAALEAGIEVAFAVSWTDGVHGGDFLFLPTEKVIAFTPNADSPTVNDSCNIVALGWYLDAIVPIVAPCGIFKYRAENMPS